MRVRSLIAVALALASCGAEENGAGTAPLSPSAQREMTQCDPPSALVPDGSAEFRKAFASGSTLLEQTKQNVSRAFSLSCAAGVLKREPVRKVGDFDSTELTLVNAPEANVASIMWRAGNGSARFELEYHFLTPEGQTHVPSAGELEEAIYCAVVGATAKEQEESGRCLAD